MTTTGWTTRSGARCARCCRRRSSPEIPFDHDIFHSVYEFPKGLPKIHEHDGGPPKGFGLFHEGRMVVFYSYNTDIGDGLEDADVHGDPAPVREQAMRMAINVVAYAMTH